MPATTPPAGAFGELLRQLRRRNGMTQSELAALVGLSVAQVSRLEQNQRLPDLAVLAEKFVPALGLQEEPRLVRRLIELAAAARGERPPAAIRLTRTVQATFEEKLVESAGPLPSAPTLLVGRQRALRALSKRLLEAPGRLVTVVGPPGVGKTRLALAAAAELQDLFAGEVHFIALAALGEPDLVAPAILASLGLVAKGPKPPLQRLVESLRRKEMLLVLDNFEQVSAAAPQLAHLLEQCAGLRLLVTSRTPLRLRAEQRFQAQPLEPAAAVELFVQRSQAINPDFTLSQENPAVIAEICLRLDCLPLAIELVAARSELFTPAQLLSQMAHGRLDLLEGGASDLPDRQRTLRNAIAWSYRLLPVEAQRLLRVLGIFGGGFDMDALYGVAGDWDADGVTDELLMRPYGEKAANLTGHLHALVASSLVVQQEVDGRRRYTMLETIHEFALEDAAAYGEAAETRSRHARYFARWATTQADWSFEHMEGVWWRNLELEHENLRAALRWSLQHDSEQALRLAVALHPFWDTRGYQREGSRWLDQALALNPAPTTLRAHGLLKAGLFSQQRMAFEPAAQMLGEALALFRQAGDQAGVAETLRAQGWLASNRGDSPRARRCFEESLALFRSLDNPAQVATVLCNLVHVLSYSAASYEQTRAYAEESLAIFQRLERPHGIALALRQLGINETRIGAYEAAAAAFGEALAIWRGRGGQRETAWTLEMLGEACWLLGDAAAASAHWMEALQLFRATEEEFGEMVTFHHLGQVARRRGDLAGAAACYVAALRYFHRLDNAHFVARCLAGLGGVALERGKSEAATHLLAAARRLFDALPPFLAPADQADYAHLAAQVRGALGEARFHQAWETGAKLSLEQAIHLAVHEEGIP